MEIEGKRGIVIYFSHTGNTEKVARLIKDITDSDIFEMVPRVEYPADYSECTKIAKKELHENARPDLKAYLEFIQKYDVIYIGYPNWCGLMPMLVLTQMEKLDFEGKVVMPFCTHDGSRMGNSEVYLKKICRGALVKPGLSIEVSDDQVKDKINEWIRT